MAAACLAAWPLGATESGHFAGRRLRDALRDLGARGLRVIYSDTLVRPEMTVTLEPSDGSPEQVLQEILAPHLLTARSGPQGSWLVVRRRVQGPTSPVSREEPVRLARPPVFPTQAERVHVNALVTQDGRPVQGLVAEDFEVRDDGVTQKVELVAPLDGPGDAPIHVVLVLDHSGSVSGGTLARLKAASIAFVGTLRPDDAVSLVSFADRIDLWPSSGGSRQDLLAAIGAAKGEGTTALHDAVFVAAKAAASPQGRSLVLVLSDGDDAGSWLSPADVLRVVREADVMAYAIEWRADKTHSPFLGELAEATGGSVWALDREEDLAPLLARALQEARSTYRLQYEPRGVRRDGRHEISVRLTRASGKVRARRSYVSPGPSQQGEGPATADVAIPPSFAAIEAIAVDEDPVPGSGVVGAGPHDGTEGPDEPSGTPLLQPLCRSGAEAPSARAYGRVLEAYLGGSAHDATAAVMPCTAEGLGPAVRAAVKNRSLLPPVVFLQTRVAVELQSRGRFADAATHLALVGDVVAEGLKGRAARDTRVSDSLKRWLVGAANYCAAGFNPEAAKRFLDLCLGYFPDEAVCWLAAGTLYESTAFPDGFAGVALPVPPGIARHEAESHYRRALRLDPDLVEARLRLGRVLEKQGDFGEAERHLEWVTRHGDDPFLVAFAWLFRGEIAERQGELGQAVRNYGFAVEVEPAMRAGLLGLSHALHRQGLRALSGELLEAVLVASRGRHDNLWLDYHRGPARRLHRAVQALRDEAERALQSPSAVARVD